MKILIAEDEPVSRRLLQRTLQHWGYEVLVASDGEQAWACLSATEAPQIAIIDWMMPGIDGAELCCRVRSLNLPLPVYLMFLTSRSAREDIVAGFRAGADDYIVKPFDEAELRARLQVGVRVVQLQVNLADRVRELEDALSRVKQLQGLLPICSYCKKIRDDRNYWQQVEQYVTERSEARFTHGICPSCYERHIKPELDQLRGGSRDGQDEAAGGGARVGQRTSD